MLPIKYPEKSELLSRDDFRNSVFERDNHQCIICGSKEKLDAHHLLEKKLWDDAGYYIQNGVTLCEKHHIFAEQTILSCDELRNVAKIDCILLPSHFYSEYEYEKWGGIIFDENGRIPGELFNDISVQKILKAGNVLHLYLKYIKYPRTLHLPFSPGRTKDDRIMEDCLSFEGKEIVVTVKYDGECTTAYNNFIHARALSYDSHISKNWMKNFHSKIKHNITEGWRVCGENLWAKHSIHYNNLKDYFLCFSIWNNKNECLSWDETLEWAELIGVKMVDVLYRGKWDEELLKKLYQPIINRDECEGFVVRIADRFNYSQFRKCVGKWVRSDHVTTSNHWKFEKIIRNELAKE